MASSPGTALCTTRSGSSVTTRPWASPTREVALTVSLDDCELDRKRRVLAAHASQTEGLAEAMGEATYRTWFVDETFRRPRAGEITAARAGSAPGVLVG